MKDTLEDYWKNNDYWTDNNVVISYWPSLRKPWVVICPGKNHKLLDKFKTLDEAKDYCQNSGLELVYWSLTEG